MIPNLSHSFSTKLYELKLNLKVSANFEKKLISVLSDKPKLRRQIQLDVTQGI